MNHSRSTVSSGINKPSQMTARDWYDWLVEQERCSFEEYCGRPKRLISDFRSEKAFTGDYEGREILELLQNANDAATDAGVRGRTRIELKPAGLVVANTGAAFSTDGVSSLLLAHVSPKRKQHRQMVGNKGLGFRAVLNWTRFPFILTGNLALIFSEAVARKKQQELEERSPELRGIIEEEKQLSGPLVVPLLAFPGFNPEGDLASLLDTEDHLAISDRCRALRAEGFETAIGMPFYRESDHAEARKQIRMLRPEVLLFAPGLEELEIVVDNEPPMRWRHDTAQGGTSKVYVDPDDSAYREWKVYSKRGPVPRKYLPADQPQATDYEVVLAIPTNHTAKADCLYSYFPTEVRFPYPLVCHVTLDLQTNRQQPLPTKANDFILGELAKFMAETAEKIAQERRNDVGLALIASESSTADGLEKFGFGSRLLQAAKTRSLVPTITDGLVTPDKARCTGFSDVSWLPDNVFRNVVKLTSGAELGELLEALEVEEISPQDWVVAGGKLAFPTMDSRADFIAGIIRHEVTDAFALPNLLLDAAGKPVPKGYRVFLPPAGQREFSLPEWFEIRFLHPDLRQALTDRLKSKDQDVLASSLSPLGVTRYSLDAVLSALVSQANRRAKAEPNQQADFRRDLLLALWSLFPRNEPREERPRFPKEAQVLLRSKSGSDEDARQLYLGAEYGFRGRILEGLFGSFAPAKLIASPQELGLSEAPEMLAEFFVWLGVADLPRAIKSQPSSYPFKRYVKEHLPYPLQIGGDIVHDASELNETHLQEVVSLDDLDDILTKGDPTAILAWLAVDDRAIRWKSPAVEHGKFGNRKRYAQNPQFFTGPIPSYVRWRLQTAPWLPRRDGQPACPKDCIAEAIPGLEKLFPTPRRPTASELNSYGIHSALLRDAFDRAGVIPGLSQIDPGQVYTVLLSLPTRDQQGAVAKAFYHAILDHFDGTQFDGCPERQRFQEEGHMWARCGSVEQYWPVMDLWHVDSEDVPAALCRNLRVVSLPKRSGSDKVKSLFGVNIVERSQIKRHISQHRPVPDAQVITDEIVNLKPLILALRRSRMIRTGQSEEFRQLAVIVCLSIEGEVEFQGQKQPLHLSSWDWILDDETHTAYVLADPEENEPLTSHLFADAVGQIFAAVFRLGRGDEFARLVSCQRKDRLKILRRLAGDENIPGMEELERRYQEVMVDAESREIHVPDSALFPPTLSSPPSAQGDGTTSSGEQETDLPEEPTGDQLLQITPVHHIPSGPACKVSCRVSRKMPTGPRRFAGRRRVMDPTFCEWKAMEFEELGDPPRFPIRVGQITGYLAPGVDVLSFASAGARAQFLEGDHREVLVARFIEVKGRSTDGATIDLRGNELGAARKYRERYFLYRIYDASDGAYDLAILNNPLADETGVSWFVEINLEAATRTQEFELAGGMTVDSYRQQLTASQPVTSPAP